jgi:hypothetical protein
LPAELGAHAPRPATSARMTLVLDLDDTLIHAVLIPETATSGGDDIDVKSMVTAKTPLCSSSSSDEGELDAFDSNGVRYPTVDVHGALTTRSFSIRLRPHVHHFLQQCALQFDVCVSFGVSRFVLFFFLSIVFILSLSLSLSPFLSLSLSLSFLVSQSCLIVLTWKKSKSVPFVLLL